LTLALIYVLLLFMATTEKRARAEAMLGELAEHGLMVAKELAVRLRECEDAGEAVALANAFQKVSRVVRMTLALDFKLDRDAARDAREAEQVEAERLQAEADADAPVTVAPRRTDPVEGRKTRVANLLNRLLWTESEGDEYEYEILTDDLTSRLEEAALSPDFETLPIETLVQRIGADMGLSGTLTLSLCEGPPGAAGPSPPLSDSG
jgi:hypothetical protein